MARGFVVLREQDPDSLMTTFGREETNTLTQQKTYKLQQYSKVNNNMNGFHVTQKQESE